MKFPLAYETTTTREDFVRLLARATGDGNFREVGGGFSGDGWAIRLTPVPRLEIGLVRLERYRVEIAFDGLSDEEQECFMRRFSLHYQRGGG